MGRAWGAPRHKLSLRKIPAQKALRKKCCDHQRILPGLRAGKHNSDSLFPERATEDGTRRPAHCLIAYIRLWVSLPGPDDSYTLENVAQTPRVRTVPVCLLSSHPLVLSEFERVLAGPEFRLIPRTLESTLGPDLRRLAMPRAMVYVVDANMARPATGALLGNILDKYPTARVLVVAEKFSGQEGHSLLRLGAKGLLTYAEARDQLANAVSQAQDGGYWVPRAVLAGFVESVLSGAASRRIKAEGYSDLSRREQEVLDALLENQANKEIASHLNISERTVKFHVSNLLSKFGVRRRADLILLCFQKTSGTP
jgi:DNA-binding NarL/FixJ family response regulator